MVDEEQRERLRALLQAPPWTWSLPDGQFATDTMSDLLDELEQAKRERDIATKMLGVHQEELFKAERERDEAVWKRDNARLVVIPEYERQLAKVLALVARWKRGEVTPTAVLMAFDAEFEQKQKP